MEVEGGRFVTSQIVKDVFYLLILSFILSCRRSKEGDSWERDYVAWGVQVVCGGSSDNASVCTKLVTARVR